MCCVVFEALLSSGADKSGPAVTPQKTSTRDVTVTSNSIVSVL